MTLIVCPGIHSPDLTQSFLANLGIETDPLLTTSPYDVLVFPAERYPAYSTLHLLDFLLHQFSNPLTNPAGLASSTDSLQAKRSQIPKLAAIEMPLVFLGFSAGVVGAIGAAHLWQWLGGTVKALIAADGWGVPLYGNFPIHRISHDYTTHWSSALLGAGAEGFYADPPLPHLDLWRSPHTTRGWQTRTTAWFDPALVEVSSPQLTTTAEFLLALLKQYGEG